MMALWMLTSHRNLLCQTHIFRKRCFVSFFTFVEPRFARKNLPSLQVIGVTVAHLSNGDPVTNFETMKLGFISGKLETATKKVSKSDDEGIYTAVMIRLTDNRAEMDGELVRMLTSDDIFYINMVGPDRKSHNFVPNENDRGKLNTYINQVIDLRYNQD